MIEIIPASHIHGTHIAELEKLSFSEPWSLGSIINKIDNPNVLFFVAIDEIMVGYASVFISFENAYVYNLAVREEARRMGIGRQLMEALEGECRIRGAEIISLEVRQSNVPAIKLYKNLGYTITGSRVDFYTKPTEDAFIMNKNLEVMRNIR